MKQRQHTRGVEDARKFQHELMALKITGQNFITEIREALIAIPYLLRWVTTYM